MTHCFIPPYQALFVFLWFKDIFLLHYTQRFLFLGPCSCFAAEAFREQLTPGLSSERSEKLNLTGCAGGAENENHREEKMLMEFHKQL